MLFHNYKNFERIAGAIYRYPTHTCHFLNVRDHLALHGFPAHCLDKFRVLRSADNILCVSYSLQWNTA